MPRFFGDKEIELLAPCGTFEIFKKIIDLPCDAVYFGGKNLNMRLHRKDFNFTNEEIINAINIAHNKNKKVYITVNNLHDENDLNELKEYISFLSEAKPDAIIIQDFSILEYAKDLSFEIHSSVMMNVHNLETIKRLEQIGITQVVMSREVPLSYIKLLSKTTNMKFEYFIHGDMCIAHGGQCLYSGIIFGNSSNRGKCLKPCRWNYNIKTNTNEYKTEYPLAVKDMFMYEHIPELIDSGVTSFKIEGRMRDYNYLSTLINSYGDSINRYIQDPIAYDRKTHTSLIMNNRKRDLSTAYSFGKPGLSNINTRYEGTGKFYSTGKVFSTATEERGITLEKIKSIKDYLEVNKLNNRNKIRLSVKVNDYEQAKACLTKNVNEIYLSGDTFLPSKPFSKQEIIELTKNKKNKKIYISLPRMMFDIDFEEYSAFLVNDLNIDGVVCTNLGAINKFKGYSLIGDYALNIYNVKAAQFFINEGISEFTISPEVKVSDLINILKKLGNKAQLIVHGSPVAMYMEHNLFDNIPGSLDNKLMLVDELGFEHPVFKDRNSRNHLLLYKDICLLPILKELYNAGLSNFRIEGSHLETDKLIKVIDVYDKAINNLEDCLNYFYKFTKDINSVTFGALEFK